LKMKVYRIYTQNSKLKWLKSVLDELFDGYTLIKAEGYWRKQREKSLIIEVITIELDHAMQHKLDKLVKMLHGYGEQECVLITKQEIDAKFY